MSEFEVVSSAKEEFPAADLSKIKGKQDEQRAQIYKNYEYEPQPPFIDFSLLNSSTSSPRSTEELNKFKSALSSWGCFQLINHGIPREGLDEMREISRRFFGLPMEEKKKYGMLAGGNNGFEGGTVVNSNYQASLSEWNEALSLTVYPQERRQLEFWPEKPLKFREVLHEYTTKLTTLFEAIFKMVLCSLNVDEKKFGERYGKNREINTRLNYYPQCPKANEEVLGLKAHADFSAITILLQDELGLQVQKDGEWFSIPVFPDALFVNIGDPMEIMSNGIYKSAIHRVVTNPETSRVSIASFWDSDRNCEIAPLDELVTPEQPQLYSKVSHKDYINLFFSYYKSGQRQIDTLRI